MQSVWNKPKIFQPLFFQQIYPTISIQVAHTFESGPRIQNNGCRYLRPIRNIQQTYSRQEKACWAIQISFSYYVKKKSLFPINIIKPFTTSKLLNSSIIQTRYFYDERPLHLIKCFLHVNFQCHVPLHSIFFSFFELVIS